MRKVVSPKPVRVEFGPCCFCAQPIEATATDPVSITATVANDRWQVWSAHGDCFKKLLTNPPEAPSLFDPAHF